MQRQDRSFIINPALGVKQANGSSVSRLTPAADGAFSDVVHPAFGALPIAFFVAALAADIVAWWTTDSFWAESAFRLTAVGAVVTILLSLHTFLKSPTDSDSMTWQSNLSRFSVPALAIISLLVRFVDPVVGAVIPWGLVLSVVISILVFTTE